jgi:hypothetical protein
MFRLLSISKSERRLIKGTKRLDPTHSFEASTLGGY